MTTIHSICRRIRQKVVAPTDVFLSCTSCSHCVRKAYCTNTTAITMNSHILLQSAVTFRESDERSCVVPDSFATVDGAVETMIEVVLHEARDGMSRPLKTRPERPYLHPVDVDTDDPGIVDAKLNICRAPTSTIPRLEYRGSGTGTLGSKIPTFRGNSTSSAADGPPPPKIFSVSQRVAVAKAEKGEERHVAKAEKMANTVLRREDRAAAMREQRRQETPDEKETRLREQREKREARRAVAPERPTPRPSMVNTTLAPSEEPDISSRVLTQRRPKRPRGGEKYFEHPLPNHRILEGLHKCQPHPSFIPTLLQGVSCEGIEIINGPPGTGKTTSLVQRLSTVTEGRVYVCAPSNVGAANLYERCVAAGLGDECALVLVPDRVPPGVAVLSNDPTRRILCGTVSSRCGPMMNDISFSSVFLDEAAQCTEASVWTLLRDAVTLLVMAGDIRQLSAICSDTGRTLRHDRSLMERLVESGYDNVRNLTEQNRMSPEILRLANELIYDGSLTCGPHAPQKGSVEICLFADGREEADDTSYRNVVEVDAAVDILRNTEDAVFLCPYVSQCKLFLSRGTSRPVHTIDSFQGREANTVVLSMVRDGTTTLGFWSDLRRVCVALTRARTRLVILASNVKFWPEHPMRDVLLA